MKGLLFRPEMVRAILDGRKTETRRVGAVLIKLDEIVYVKETFALAASFDALSPTAVKTLAVEEPGQILSVDTPEVWFKADNHDEPHLRGRWRSSLHMPVWASRTYLCIQSVDVETLEAITEEGALAEGFVATDEQSAREVFFEYFRKLHKGPLPERVTVIRFQEQHTS